MDPGIRLTGKFVPFEKDIMIIAAILGRLDAKPTGRNDLYTSWVMSDIQVRSSSLWYVVTGSYNPPERPKSNSEKDRDNQPLI